MKVIPDDMEEGVEGFHEGKADGVLLKIRNGNLSQKRGSPASAQRRRRGRISPACPPSNRYGDTHPQSSVGRVRPGQAEVGGPTGEARLPRLTH